MAAATAGLLAVLGAGIAGKDRMRERWYLWRLVSGDEEERDIAAGKLAGMRSRRAVPILREQRAWTELLEIAGIGSRPLGHASMALALEGMDRAAVAEILGEPDAVQRRDFQLPIYRFPDPLPPFSEQWIFNHPSRLSHIYIYIEGERIVWAVEEWSDF